jgi:hypothetical protein
MHFGRVDQPQRMAADLYRLNAQGLGVWLDAQRA